MCQPLKSVAMTYGQVTQPVRASISLEVSSIRKREITRDVSNKEEDFNIGKWLPLCWPGYRSKWGEDGYYLDPMSAHSY